MNKIGLFIDQANLWSAYKKVGKIIDFKKLITYLENEFKGKIEFKNIYFAYPEEGTRDYDLKGIHNFGVFLKKELGFHVKKKALKQIEVRNNEGNIVVGTDGKPILKEKGNLDIELTMDVMQTWHHFDVMILFSGDSDFYPLVSFLQFKGKKVYVYSTTNNISSELKHHSNKYYDFCEIDDIWGAKLKYRNEKS